MKKIKPQSNKGFTLLETIVAIFVMTIAFTSLLSLMSNSLFSARYAKNEITAAYLAQEAIDYVRNSRDTVAFQGNDWNTFLVSFGYAPGKGNICFDSDGCYFEVSNPNVSSSVQACSSSGCPMMLYDPNMTKSLYGYTTGSSTVPSKFKRTILMDAVSTAPGNSNNDELQITVEVVWENGSIDRSFTLRSSLLKWQ